MGTTAQFAIPYPEPTDPVANGAANMKAIADRIDLKLTKVYEADYTYAGSTGNGVSIDLGSIMLQPARGTGLALVTVIPKWHNGSAAMGANLRYQTAANGNIGSAGAFEAQTVVSASGIGAWVGCQETTVWVRTTAGVKPQLVCAVFVAAPGNLWYAAFRLSVAEYITSP